jgi:hypothetical protein
MAQTYRKLQLREESRLKNLSEEEKLWHKFKVKCTVFLAWRGFRIVVK